MRNVAAEAMEEGGETDSSANIAYQWASQVLANVPDTKGLQALELEFSFHLLNGDVALDFLVVYAKVMWFHGK